MYEYDTLTPPPLSSSSYSPPSVPEPTDDFSILLRQMLSKSSSFSTPKQLKCELIPPPPPPPHNSSELTFPTLSSAAAAANIPAISVGHVSSSSAGATDYEPDDYDCESEEVFENLTEEMVAKPNPCRNPSKRTRAAEFHNMSEKRRRSKINEKMKALQKLIPNSNKTDKASMLDEAIEYLKQLQLQVQMLTMRNGMNMNSMCVPHGALQSIDHRPSGMNHGKQLMNMTVNHGKQLMNMTVNHETFVNPILSQNQPSILEFSQTINQEPSFGTQLGSY